MPIPFARQVASFNKHVTNRILGPITWHLPTFGRIEHVGRKSGRRFVAPMMAFRSPDRRRLTFALRPNGTWARYWAERLAAALRPWPTAA